MRSASASTGGGVLFGLGVSDHTAALDAFLALLSRLRGRETEGAGVGWDKDTEFDEEVEEAATGRGTEGR